MDLYIVRHGETHLNKSQILQGFSEVSHLNDVGIQQAKDVAKRIKNIKFDYMYSSDLERAVETSEIIFNELEHKPIFNKVKVIRERNYGDYEGLTWAEVRKLLNTDSQRSVVNAPPHGESLYEVKDRIEKFIHDLKENHKSDETILIVTHHGVVIMLFVCLLGLTFENHKNFHFDNCSLSHFYIGEKYNKLKFANDTSHVTVKSEEINI